ncbi:MAG TPA: cytochrome P450 [Deltaproteobacteria bacterium]|nr:cytochrome P450 [Deltaproteobacteria bacterium]
MEAVAAGASEKVYFNPFDAAFRANPYPSYAALRSKPPRTLKLFMPIVMVSRYADVVAVLQDQRFSADPKALLVNEGYEHVHGMLTALLVDPPIHTRIRRAVSRDFTPKRIQELEPRIREITRRLLDRIERQGTFDVIADLADPLPTIVLSELFGVPGDDYPRFKAWSDLITASVHIMPGLPLPEPISVAFTELRAYFSELAERKRRKPQGDLLSALVMQEDAERLTSEELLDFVIMQLLAGTDTTTNTMGNGFLALMRHRDQLELLRREPALVTKAVEEMLRYDGPIQANARFAKEDVEVGGTLIRKGSIAFVIFASANRDPAQFPDPEKFDITRWPNPHMGFGAGIHVCLGAALARLENAVVFDETLKRFPRLRLPEPEPKLEYGEFYFLRGLTSLPLEF